MPIDIYSLLWGLIIGIVIGLIATICIYHFS